jgi:hypothetical protein
LSQPGESCDSAAPSEAALTEAAAAIGADPAEVVRLQAKLAADEILRNRVYSLKAWDRQLAAAMPQVAVPANLELRVRQALAIAEPTLEPVSLGPVNLGHDTAAKTFSRRRWLGGIAAGGVAASAGYLAWLNWPRSRTLDQNEIADAGRWLDRYLVAERWQKTDWPDQEYPLPAVIGLQPVGWQAIGDKLRTPAVAYDYSTKDGQRAALFVIPQPAGTFTTRVPFLPQSSTQGMCIGHWQEGPNLLVLVVEGNVSRYRNFLRPERDVPVV